MLRFAGVALAALVLTTGVVRADGSGDSTAVSEQDGMWVDKNGTPTFKVTKDGTVDWYTYYGYLQYSANCLQCHGPDGLGSSYAPSLVDALKTLSYGDFLATVAQGKRNVSTSQNLVMPSFGTDKNVMCYINAIYVYLRARSDGAWGRGRPQKHAPLPKGFNKQVDSCMG